MEAIFSYSKEKDVKIITDLMMGGDGTNINGEGGELHPWCYQ